jgi:hypothetical protein
LHLTRHVLRRAFHLVTIHRCLQDDAAPDGCTLISNIFGPPRHGR